MKYQKNKKMAQNNNGRPQTYLGSDIIKAVNPQNNRRPVLRDGKSFKPVEPNRQYGLAELLSRTGKPAITTIPPRVKGAF